MLILLSSVGSRSISARSFLNDISQPAMGQLSPTSRSLVELRVRPSPEAVSPGQSFNLDLQVKNNSPFQASPEITIGSTANLVGVNNDLVLDP